MTSADARVLQLEQALRVLLETRDGQVVHRAALEGAQKALNGAPQGDYREALLLSGFRILSAGHTQTVFEFVSDLVLNKRKAA